MLFLGEFPGRLLAVGLLHPLHLLHELVVRRQLPPFGFLVALHSMGDLPHGGVELVAHGAEDALQLLLPGELAVGLGLCVGVHRLDLAQGHIGVQLLLGPLQLLAGLPGGLLGHSHRAAEPIVGLGLPGGRLGPGAPRVARLARLRRAPVSLPQGALQGALWVDGEAAAADEDQEEHPWPVDHRSRESIRVSSTRLPRARARA
mmetsp:Transcript_117976/g.320173  ORF Transcript_117976/g.320173 Transcript_117976/m.320173 type:complete len:203 (+) Transcript_117976:1106-1714(+)